MSDEPFAVTPEYIEAMKSRDSRFAMVERAIAIETDLRDNQTIKAIIGAIKADADQAMEDLADLSPADTVAVSGALVRVRTLVYMRRTLNAILQRGAVAEQSLSAEDHRSDE